MERQIFSPDELQRGFEYRLAFTGKEPEYSVFLESKNLGNRVVCMFSTRFNDMDEYGIPTEDTFVHEEQSVFFRDGNFTDDERRPLTIHEVVKNGSLKRKFSGGKRKTRKTRRLKRKGSRRQRRSGSRRRKS